ncbi:unnamed protein product [Adineta ricciae]|uniref:Lipoxygenase domain-containing protein n=1 Tax=Adineta ricciae TaxID=249248 RepID=A0A815MPN0_ADIRI|nr:unnamed protein product [Adineta ricciae]
MVLNTWFLDHFYNLDTIIRIGWLALIFAPFNKISKYCIILPTLLFSIECILMLLFRDLPVLNWISLKDLLMTIIVQRKQFYLMDLWIAQWMVYNFYAGCGKTASCGSYHINKTWTSERYVFTILLFLTYLAAPLGLVLYIVGKHSFLKEYQKNVQNVIKNDHFHIDQLKHPFSIPHTVRFADRLPESLSSIYYFLLGIIGLTILFTIVLPSYIGLIIYCRIVYKYSSSSLSDLKTIPESVRNVTAEMRLTLIKTDRNQRRLIWHLKYLLLQFATIFEYASNYSEPFRLFQSLEEYFRKIYHTPYFVLGNGIAVNSYDIVKRYIQDLPPRKDAELLAWEISPSLETFCDFTTVFLSTDHPDTQLGRKIIFQWLHSFPHNLKHRNFEMELQLSRIVPRHMDKKPTKDLVYQAIGEVMFVLATNGELTKSERLAYISCVQSPFIFFPNWFNFLLNGHHFERKNLRNYYTLLRAFLRYENGLALQAAFMAAEKKKSREEVLKFITVVFCVAGSPAPAKLAVTVIDRLWADKEKNVPLFKKNPHNVIKECARLDKAVPTVNILATDEIVSEVEKSFESKIQIPENTPIHCSIVNANRDKTVFENPDEFLPDRLDLNKILVWNGVEEDIINPDQSKRPIRYCPGHDLSLDIVQYVAERFSPVTDDIDEDNTNNKNEQDLIVFEQKIRKLTPIEESHCWNVLDTYTKVVRLLMTIVINESNLFPSRAIDIAPPMHLPIKNFSIFRIDMAKFIPSWDEDKPNGSRPLRRFARWLVNSNIWDFYDCLAGFDTLAQGLAWRSQIFPSLPLPNIVYTDMFSDEAMGRLAFFGCACHYTQRIDKSEHPSLQNAVYVNDMTVLSIFRVRKPFERYGAAAYFDGDFQLIAIYWCHANRLVRKDDQFWEHAKYVWRSSFFAYVTIHDHLIVTHMIECNALVTATRKYLTNGHPLRLFLQPFTYHTVSVNYQAAISLVNRRGLVHRVWAFDYDEFLKVCDYISMTYKFRLLPEYIPSSMSPENNSKTKEQWDKVYPIYSDLNHFWKGIHKYVENFFHITFNVQDDDKLPVDARMTEFINELCKQLGIPGIVSLKRFIDVLAHLIVSGTGMHEHVGQISDYVIDPRFIGAKLEEGKEIQNIQTYTQILILTVVTGVRMPGLLEDWSHLIERNQYYEKNLVNYENFKNELKNLSQDIDHRNKTRKYPFESFNPKFIECSASV